MAHITGGGITENLDRTLPSHLDAVVHRGAWRVPAVFSAVAASAGLDDDGMYRTFNMGIGFALVVDPAQAAYAAAILRDAGETVRDRRDRRGRGQGALRVTRLLPIGVLLSGSGTNLQAIIDRAEDGSLPVDVRVAISNKADAYGLDRARNHGISAVHVDPKAYADRSEYNAAVRDELQAAGVEYVVMAGYMKLLGTEVLNAFPMRVVNLHPAMLPSFPGAHGIADAFEYGVKFTGVTVHFADEVFDRGPIIAQEAVRIEESDTLESLENKIHAVEHVLLPDALKLIAEGRVEVQGRRARILRPADGRSGRRAVSRLGLGRRGHKALLATNPSCSGASFTPNPARTIEESCSVAAWCSLC